MLGVETMEKKVVYGCVLTNLLGVSLVFNSPVEAEEVVQNDALVELQTRLVVNLLTQETELMLVGS